MCNKLKRPKVLNIECKRKTNQYQNDNDVIQTKLKNKMLIGNAGEAPQLINKVLIEVRLHPHKI